MAEPQKILADTNMANRPLIGLSMRATQEDEGDMTAVMTEKFSGGVQRHTYFSGEQAVAAYATYVRKSRELKARIAAGGAS